MPDGFDQGGRELLAARLAFIDRHRLVVVLGAAVAVLTVEVSRRQRLLYFGGGITPVLALGVGAGRPGVPHSPKLTQIYQSWDR